MRLGERVKPLLLATLLTFMVGSYFVSDTFTRGRSFNGVSFPYEFVAQAVCLSRPDNEHAACYASVAEAFVPTNLACTSTLRDLSLCKKPAKGTKKKRENSCQEEARRGAECLQVHLEPQLQRRGFSSEEIARLGLGNQDPTEQHPAPPGGGEGEGQGGKGERSEGSAAGGKKAGVVPEEAGGDGGGDGGGAGPKVEVVEGPKDRDSIAR